MFYKSGAILTAVKVGNSGILLTLLVNQMTVA